jgi:hemerythrin-like domain-containing protein
MPSLIKRRRVLLFAAASGVALATAATAAEEEGSKEVEAVEDLMREHGVLRRALLVYAEAASRLERGRGEVSLKALGDTAQLFRTFGEDYHEKAVEEAYVFPALLKKDGPYQGLVTTLKQQHERGREITEYISAATRGRGPLQPEVLTAFVRMYAHHAAIEDTVLFPAWKRTLSDAQYRELSEKFEEIEKRQLGSDGFEHAVAQIHRIEETLGIADLAQLTAAAPPAVGAGGNMGRGA